MAKKKKAARKPAGKKPAKKKATKKKPAKKATRKTAKKAAKKKVAKKKAAKKKVAKKKAAKKKVAKKRTAKKKSARRPSAAFMKPMTPDATLAAVIGSNPQPRTEITKRIWAYIRKNGLQDDKNRRMINADDKLETLFGGKKQVSMFELTKLVNNHLS